MDYNLSNGVPSYIPVSGSGFSNYTTDYTVDTHGGSTQSYLIEAKGIQFGGSANINRYFPNLFVTEGLTLNAWVKINNPDVSSNSEINFRFYFRNSLSNIYYYSYYYLSQKNSYANQTNFNYVNLNITQNVWVNLNINITEAVIDLVGSLDNIYLSNFRIDLYSTPDASAMQTLILDDTAITNNTGYNYTPQGDFEGSVTNWNHGTPSAPGKYVINEGKSYAEGTISNSFEGQRGYIEIYKSVWSSVMSYSIWEGASNLKLDWNYTSTLNGGNDQNAYISLSARNSSYNVNLFWYLANDTSITYVNSSSLSSTYQYYFPKNIKNQWNSIDIDIYSTLIGLNISNVRVTFIDFQLNSGTNKNSSVSLQVDNFGYWTYPVDDPSFERDFDSTPTVPFNNWYTAGQGYPAINRTTDAHSGDWAANITVEGGQSQRIFRNMFLDVKDNYYTDFWFRMDAQTIDSDTYSIIYFIFDNGNYIYYILSQNHSIYNLFSNSTSIAYYFINATSGWNNINRNLMDDISYFSDQNTILTSINIRVDASTSNKVSIIFDDMNFIQDISGPVFSGFDIKPPLYDDRTDIDQIIFTDFSTVTKVDLYYNNSVEYVKLNTTRNNLVFNTSIPKMKYGSTLEFYMIAYDRFNNSANSLDQWGSAFSYFVNDTTPPIINFFNLQNNSIYSGKIAMNIKSIDDGAGINSIGIFVDDIIIANLTEDPFDYILDTRTIENGYHKIKVISSDNEKNDKIMNNISIITNNDFDSPSISDIIINPSKPIDGANISIYSSIIDESNISIVTLYTSRNDGSWREIKMNKTGNLYSANIDPINKGEVLKYYLTAIDQFNQSSSKGSENDPFIYRLNPPVSILGNSNTSGTVSNNYVEQARNIFDNYEFYFGVGSVVSFWILVKIITFSRRRKGKKSN